MVGRKDSNLRASPSQSRRASDKKSNYLRLLVLYKKFLNFREIKKATDVANLNGRGERIRTFDLMFPKHARYQAAPHPVITDYFNILY